MSLFDRGTRTGAALVALLALSACTAGPLYGTTGISPATGASTSILTELRGRIALGAVDTRTAQIVRNELDFLLNGAEPVRNPLYELRFTASGSDQTVSIQSGTGIPTAGLFRLQVNYALVRLSDGQTIDTGSRFASAPYDRSEQLFASQRAVLDAREQAGEDAASRVVLAITPRVQRDYVSPLPAVAGPAPVAPPAVRPAPIRR